MAFFFQACFKNTKVECSKMLWQLFHIMEVNGDWDGHTVVTQASECDIVKRNFNPFKIVMLSTLDVA